MTNFVCIGVPYYIGEEKADRAEVEAIKASGIAEELGAQWIDIDIAPDFAAHDDRIVAVNRTLAETIAAHRDHVPLVFTFSSDCMSALGVLKGLERHQPAVVWYDAHGDFNTPETSPSGFPCGMPLATLVGRCHADWLQGVGLAPLDERDVIITDARDLDPKEGEMLRASDITHLPSVDDLLIAPLPDKPLYIHVDTDVVDAAEMPAMSYPAPGGPTLKQVVASLERLACETEIVGALFSLWNDTLGGAEQSRQGVLQMVRAVAGW